MDGGIDTRKFNPREGGFYYENMLYYGDGKLTDNYYIREVYLRKNNTFTNKGKHIIYVLVFSLPIVQGTYLTTSPIKGVAMPTKDPKTAFATVVKGPERPADKPLDMVMKTYVEFL